MHHTAHPRVATALPEVRIDALVNSYNLPIAAHNPDLDHAYAYTKAKHRDRDRDSLLGVPWRRAHLMWQLRATRYDLAVLATGAASLVRYAWPAWSRRSTSLAFTTHGRTAPTESTCASPSRVRASDTRWRRFGLLAPLGIAAPPGPLVLEPDPDELAKARNILRHQAWFGDRPTLAVHISARKPSQRWPAECFVAALRALAERHDVQFMLLWSPGQEDNPLHPGDDNKAAAIAAALPNGFPLLPWPTAHLDQLIGGLAACSGMLCSDGGAMHIGAALGLPIACFFGQSDVATWRPWGVPHEIMQAPSLDVADISAEQPT